MNQAAADLESTVKAGEEAVREHMQSIAENQKMSDEVRSRLWAPTQQLYSRVAENLLGAWPKHEILR